MSLSAEALSRAIETNMIEYQSDLGRSSRVTLKQTDEITWVQSDISNPRYNRVMRACMTDKTIDQNIHMVLDAYRSLRVPVFWHTGPSTCPTQLGERLQQEGLAYRGDEVGMALDLSTLVPASDLPPGLLIRAVSSDSDLAVWSRVFTESYHLPVEDAPLFESIESDLAGNPNRRPFLLFQDEQPVTIATLFLGNQTAGIFCVGTIPSARRQGLGSLVMHHILAEARQAGYDYATLNASPMGAGVYHSLGFKDYCILGRYFLPAPQ
jgi:GNAT superfamily N-acetyltransferase